MRFLLQPCLFPTSGLTYEYAGLHILRLGYSGLPEARLVVPKQKNVFEQLRFL